MIRRSNLHTAMALLVVAACHGHGTDPSPDRATQPTRSAAKPQSEAVPVALASEAVLSATIAPAPFAGAVGAPALHVPRSPRSIVLSRHFDVATWGASVSTHTLLDESGHGAVPVSEARFLWDHRTLYVQFYAGDLDLQVRTTRPDGPVWKDDSFTLSFPGSDGRKRMITVSATGVIADGDCAKDAATLADAGCDLRWSSGARVVADYDGTINKLGDFDEEWNIQIAIPLRSILGAPPKPGTSLTTTVARCEIAYDGRRECGAWGTISTPAQLILD